MAGAVKLLRASDTACIKTHGGRQRDKAIRLPALAGGQDGTQARAGG